jgi:hypothetical protein
MSESLTLYASADAPEPAAPEPYTESEEHQALTAWADTVKRVAARLHLAHRPNARRLDQVARRAFVLGFVTGVRCGHTGPALTGVEVPAHAALFGVGALTEGDVPEVGQHVRYHGSVTHLWGRYWVQAVKECADPETGRPAVALTLYRGRRLYPSRIRPQSVTVQVGCWWNPDQDDDGQAPGIA